jgi:hypothetical protein
MLAEMDRHDWVVVKECWDMCEELTELKTARAFCYAVLDALGVQTRYKHLGLSLEIDVVNENDSLKEELDGEIKN